MPFLRPVAAAADAVAVELRSSRTLIGAGASACDVVLPDARGVLEVHALLSLSPAKSSGSLVPFSAAAGGACFLNGRQVPQEGARVVHGDRLAFGGAEANAFVFELTGRASASRARDTASPSSQQASSRAFRRAVDALRGGRDAAQTAQAARSLSAASAASASKLERGKEGVGASREAQFEQLLAAASSDSALSEYVERKLRQRQSQRRSQSQSQSLASASGTDSELRRGGRSMMEPPPSLLSSMSESAASMAASPFKDSILDRTGAKALTSPTALKSTAEKNYAEIEKLRLSQRMRQVNRVLNGDLAFGESYMAESPGRARDTEEEDVRMGNSWSRTRPRDSTKQLKTLYDGHEAGNGDEEEEEEEDEEELPPMMEKPSRVDPLRQSSTPFNHGSASPEARQEELQASLVLGHSREDGNELMHSVDANTDETATQPNGAEGDKAEDSLADSLPGFSELQRGREASSPSAQSRKARTKVAKASTDASTIASEPVANAPRPKTALHQKLIDQAIHQRRLEALALTFVRWHRGLRVQAQRRRWKAQQRRELASRLAVLHRDRAFATWKRVADIQAQVVSCRLDAFQSRAAARSARNAWTAWRRLFFAARRAKLALRAVVARWRLRQTRSAFRTWEAHSHARGATARERQLQLEYGAEKDARLNHTARWHRDRQGREKQRQVLLRWHQTAKNGSQLDSRLVHTARQHFARVSGEKLRRALVNWRRVASQQVRRRCIIRRLLHRQAGQRLARALARWRLESRRAREEERVALENARVLDQSKREMEQLGERHRLAQKQIEAAASEKLHELAEVIKRKDGALAAMEARLRHLDDVERQVKDKTAALRSLETQVEQHRSQKCDARVAAASEELEQLLGLSDRSPDAARFRASQFLVASMLDQKAGNTNARVRLQEDLMASLSKLDAAGHRSLPSDVVDESPVPKSVSFLQGLLQQRVTRLHQLHQSIATLAAATLGARDEQQIDPERERHSRFLADVMAQREAQHAVDMMRLLRRARLALPPPAAKY